MAETLGRVCEVEGCGRPHRARGLCTTHYNQQHQPDRHHPVLISCYWCGKECLKSPSGRYRTGRAYCSMSCRDKRRMSTPEGREQVRDAIAKASAASAAARASAKGVAERKLRAASAGTRGWGVLVAGICARPNCGEYFVRRYAGAVRPSPFCSSKCRRTERQRQRGIDDELRLAIYERDGWRCQIEGCGKPIKRGAKVPDPLAPTVDHLLPQVAGGGDEPANLRAAHFICNSGRRDRGTVQLALIG